MSRKITIFEPKQIIDIMNNLYLNILRYLQYHPESSRSEIMKGIGTDSSPASVKRRMADAVAAGDAVVIGAGRATKFKLAEKALLLMPFDIDTYFQKEVDDREIHKTYNFDLISDLLPKVDIFTTEEMDTLNTAQQKFRKNISELTDNEYRKEMERLGVDLSWKSSQIEGNTYTLLETERLLKEKIAASGKTQEEAIMLLNHKDALKFVLANPGYMNDLTIHRIEDIHSILTKELNVDKGIRRRRVGITGTNYSPLDNQYQIEDALKATCELINGKENRFEKALLAILLLSYIQPFSDGNKRTARITGNALLLAGGYCPMSFRSIDSIDYKKAMLIFYEQNNISAFKKIFIDQYLFAVESYF